MKPMPRSESVSRRRKPAEVPAPPPESAAPAPAPAPDPAAQEAAEAPAAEVETSPDEGRGERSGGGGSGAAGGAPVVSPERLDGAVEAILFSLDRPITSGRLAEALRLGATEGVSAAAAIDAAIARLNKEYERSGRAFRIERVAGGHRVMTVPQFADAVAAFHADRAGGRLSRAAVETLAIIAYRQPVTRAELEAIRGVACGEVLRSLLERRLIAITGRADEVGRPMLYGTTKRFLEVFGLASIKDLPPAGELNPTTEA